MSGVNAGIHTCVLTGIPAGDVSRPPAHREFMFQLRDTGKPMAKVQQGEGF